MRRFDVKYKIIYLIDTKDITDFIFLVLEPNKGFEPTVRNARVEISRYFP